QSEEGVLSGLLLDSETVCANLPSVSEFQRTIEAVSVDQPTAPLMYLAPEQRDGSGRLGPATDVYALGATLYFMLTGEAPLAAAGRSLGELLTLLQRPQDAVRQLRARAPELPQEAERLLGRMMLLDPHARPGLD